jgi:hypothetical protein
MAEIGMLYFSGGLLNLLFMLYMGETKASLFMLSILNALALPYSFFSIIYQAFVVRAWCRICVAIQILLWGEFYLLFVSLNVGFTDFEWPLPLSFILGITLPILLWIGIRPLILRSRRIHKLELKLCILKRNPIFIRGLLAGMPRIDVKDLDGDIKIGPDDSPINFTLVLNFSCPSCFHVLRQMIHLVHSFNGQLKVNIRLVNRQVSTLISEMRKKLYHEIAVYIIQLAFDENHDEALKVLLDWNRLREHLSSKKLASLKKVILATSITKRKKAELFLLNHNKWAKDVSITEQSAIFLNGILLPLEIQPEDLHFFLLQQMEN